MKLGVFVVIAAVGLAVGVTACGDDDYFPDEPTTDTDASVAPAPSGSASPGDAGAEDAATLDPDASTPIEQCATCVVTDCGPKLLECLVDEACRTLITCAVQSGCLSDPQSCLGACLADSELTPAEIFSQLVKLQAIATSCSACLGTCGSATGVDAGLGDFGGFGGGFP